MHSKNFVRSESISSSLHEAVDNLNPKTEGWVFGIFASIAEFFERELIRGPWFRSGIALAKVPREKRLGKAPRGQSGWRTDCQS